MTTVRRGDALEYHAGERAGKIEVRATKPCVTPRELRLAYVLGSTHAAQAIRADAADAYRYTIKGNLVGVVTNGTAVPGLGDVGPLAAKPVQEGTAVLFKRLADIDVFDLELDADTPERFVDAVRMVAPTFGGILLKDVRAPDGLEIYERLCDVLPLPVFHENLYGAAIVTGAALINAVDLADKELGKVRIVIAGAGTVGLGCARLLHALGAPREHLWLYDVRGLLRSERSDLDRHQRDFARADGPETLVEGLRGADVFVGASVGGALSEAMILSMAPYPMVFALALPEPEIEYDAARAARRDVVVGTSRSGEPNVLSDLLSFPFIFRGALDVRARRITMGMMLAAARALADLAREGVPDQVVRAYGRESLTFGPEYLLPKSIDPRILPRVSAAVAMAAIAEGAAATSVGSAEYAEDLVVRHGTGRETMRQLTVRARELSPRVVLPDGTDERVVRAGAMLEEEGTGRPILLGPPDEIRRTAERLGVELGAATLVEPARSPQLERYVDRFFAMRSRRGITPAMARRRAALPRHFAALMLDGGDADLLVGGVNAHYAESMRTVLEIIGPASGVRRVASLHMVLRGKDVLFLTDTSVNIEPTAEDLAETALLSARTVRALGLVPRVAMVSFSNFGSVEHRFARKVREAVERIHALAPELVVDGEMQLAAALDEEMRARHFPFTALRENANVLVLPDLQSGNALLHYAQHRGDAVVVGPVLMGTRRPVHVVQYGATVLDVFNLATVGAVLAG